MVLFTKSFLVNCESDLFFIQLQDSFPEYIKHYQKKIIDEYKIIEKKDNKIVVNIKKDNVLQFIPKSFVSLVSKQFIDSVTSWKELQEFDNELKTITWTSSPIDNHAKIYNLFGKTTFSLENENSCKVTLSFEFHFLPEASHSQMQRIIFGMLEKQIPYIIFYQIKNLYVSFANHQKSL